MKSGKKRIVIAGLIMVILIAGLLTFRYTFQTSDVSVEKSKADLQITATELINAYENNEDEANQLYLDKIIIVTGNAESYEDNGNLLTITLKNEGDLAGILCSFDKSAIDTSKIKLNQTMQIKGRCTGYLLDVVLAKCVIVE